MSNSTNNHGIGFAGLLAIVFITLKLCGVISWAWLWVLSPLWIGLAVALGVLVGAVCIALVAALISALLALKK